MTSTLSIFINSFSMVLAPTHSGYFRPPSTGSIEEVWLQIERSKVKVLPIGTVILDMLCNSLLMPHTDNLFKNILFI